MSTRSGVLSYGDGKPGVVQAGPLLPVDEPMICRPIDVVAHQNASMAVNRTRGSEATASRSWSTTYSLYSFFCGLDFRTPPSRAN